MPPALLLSLPLFDLRVDLPTALFPFLTVLFLAFPLPENVVRNDATNYNPLSPVASPPCEAVTSSCFLFFFSHKMSWCEWGLLNELSANITNFSFQIYQKQDFRDKGDPCASQFAPSDQSCHKLPEMQIFTPWKKVTSKAISCAALKLCTHCKL
jgi:hypothetical protein